MIRNSKIYIYFTLIISLISLILVAIFNFKIDPLNLLNKEKSLANSKTKLFYETVLESKYGVYIDEKKFSFRDIKRYFALNNSNKECAIIGSSVVDMINGNLKNKDGNDLNSLNDNCSSILNLSIPQHTYEDYFALSYMLLQNPNPPKKIIFSIDPHSFMKFNYFWDYFAEEYYSMYNLVFSENKNKSNFFIKKDKYKRYFENLLSFEYFLISIKQKFLDKSILPEKAEYFDPEKGSKKIHIIFSDGSGVGERKTFEKKDFTVIEDFRVLKDEYFQDNAYFEFEKLINYLSKNFEVMLLLTPRHTNNFNVEYQKTRNALNFIEKKVYNLSNKTNINLLGSYDPNKVNCNREEFVNYLYAKFSCLKKIKKMN